MRLNAIAMTMMMVVYGMACIMLFNGDGAFLSKGELLDSAVLQFRWVALVFALLSMVLMVAKKPKILAISSNITYVFVVALLFIETLFYEPASSNYINLLLTIAAAAPVLLLIIIAISQLRDRKGI
jgi:hypothetical protein